MYDLDYLDEEYLAQCKKTFSRRYPEFKSTALGVSQDKTSVIMSCDFPDGTFYFRVDLSSISSAYNTKEDADRM